MTIARSSATTTAPKTPTTRFSPPAAGPRRHLSFADSPPGSPAPAESVHTQPACPASALAVAQAAFALLQKLDSGRRRPPPSIPKVFRLYCIDLLSAAQVARKCRCSKAAVIRRLNLIRKKTGLPTARLRNLGPQPPSLQDLVPDPRARTARSNLLDGDYHPDGFAE